MYLTIESNDIVKKGTGKSGKSDREVRKVSGKTRKALEKSGKVEGKLSGKVLGNIHRKSCRHSRPACRTP